MKTDDRTLAQRAKGGDESAFTELLDRYERPIFNLALRITGDWADAKDCTQEAFLRAYQNLDRYDPEHRFFSWLYRIGINAALDCVGDRWRRADDVEKRASDPDPEGETLGREISGEIQEALLELSEELRVVVVLRHFHGLSYAEMGEVVGVPAKTVKSRLYSARQRLRELLSDRGLSPRRRES
jgi:RNA polymerase sigma-70 factor (ECF subfamily)